MFRKSARLRVRTRRNPEVRPGKGGGAGRTGLGALGGAEPKRLRVGVRGTRTRRLRWQTALQPHYRARRGRRPAGTRLLPQPRPPCSCCWAAPRPLPRPCRQWPTDPRFPQPGDQPVPHPRGGEPPPGCCSASPWAGGQALHLSPSSGAREGLAAWCPLRDGHEGGVGDAKSFPWMESGRRPPGSPDA